MNKQYLAETRREIEAWEGVTITQEEGGKHGRVTLHYGGESRFVVVSNTPSDALGIKNHIALVRRILKQMGAVKALPASNQNTRETKKPVRVAMPTEPAPVRENPFLKLEQPVMATQNNPIDAIFASIERLRYSEMLEFASILSITAVHVNMRRNRVNEWAEMLQAAAEGQRVNL